MTPFLALLSPPFPISGICGFVHPCIVAYCRLLSSEYTVEVKLGEDEGEKERQDPISVIEKALDKNFWKGRSSDIRTKRPNGGEKKTGHQGVHVADNRDDKRSQKSKMRQKKNKSKTKKENTKTRSVSSFEEEKKKIKKMRRNKKFEMKKVEKQEL